MTTLQAHACFCNWPEEDRQRHLPGQFWAELPRGNLDAWPVYATAAAALSGFLAGAGPDELGEALDHFRSLLSAEIIGADQWQEEAERAVAEFLEWGSQFDEEIDKELTAHERN